MAVEPLRLLPFTNWSLILNTSFNLPREHNRGSEESNPSVSNHGDNNLHPTSSSTEDMEEGYCHEWKAAQHTLFQLANLCAAVSLLTPSSFRHHLLFLRSLLAMAYLLFMLWAGLLVCMIDVLLWNCVFCFVDSVHVIFIVCSNIPDSFMSSLNDLYIKKLKPLKVCRQDFAEFCRLGDMVWLGNGECYSVENQTPCGEKVSILLKGRLKVTHEGVFLHSVEPNEFVDSPEFDSLPLHSPVVSEKFQVTVTATEESLVISWSYPNLRDHFVVHPFLSAVFRNIVGKDISDKLYRIQELILRSPEEEIHPPFISRNSSMVNVRRYLQSTDDQDKRFVNGKKESDLHLLKRRSNITTGKPDSSYL